MDLHVYRNSQDRWHDLKAAARVQGAVLASNAVTLDELVQRLTPDLAPASPAQRLVIAQRALAEAGRPGAPGVVRYACDAVAELKAARVGVPDLRSTGMESLARILESYNRFMAAAHLVDSEDRCWIAAARAADGSPWVRRFDQAVVHAIYDLNGAEFMLLHNLIAELPLGGTVMLFNATANVKPTQFAEWTWQKFIYDEALADKTVPEFFRASGPAKELLERLFVFETSDFHSVPLQANDRLRLLQCAGRYQEIETIAGEIADLLDSGADAGDIAVVVRHIDTYGEMIEDVFHRYGVRHTFETGIPLLRVPFIKYWMSLLDLVASERSRDACARVMSSAYYVPRLSPAADVERTLAAIGYIDRRHMSASALAARRGSALTAEFERFESILDGLETASARPLQFLDRLQPGSPLTGRDLEAWQVLCDEIGAVDGVMTVGTGETPFADFHEVVSQIAGLRTVGRRSDRGFVPGLPRVRIVHPRTLGYRSYRWVFAPGFCDGEIPGRAEPNPLLPDATIELLNRQTQPRRLTTSRDRNRREPLYLFMLLDSAMDRVTLTWPGSTLEGEAIYPSIYVGEITRHYETSPVAVATRSRPPREMGECLRTIANDWRLDRIDLSHAQKLLDAGTVQRVQWEGRGSARADMPRGAVSVDGIWSPSQLNVLAECPFVFLARHRLKLKISELPDFEVPVFEIGNLAHRILREFYSRPIPNSEGEALVWMNEVIARQLATIDISGQGPSIVIDPALWRIRRPQLVRALLEYVKFAVQDARAGYETLPEYLDRPFPAAQLGKVMIAGRPDHVAVRRNKDGLTGIRIDDFKYSAASSSTSRQLKQSFQIPVYAQLAMQALNADAGVPVEGRYLLLRSPSSPVVARAVDQSVCDEIVMRIDELVEKVQAGRLHPDPEDPQDCHSCDYRRLCRLYGS